MCVKAASAGRSDVLMVCRYENWRRHMFDTIDPHFYRGGQDCAYLFFETAQSRAFSEKNRRKSIHLPKIEIDSVK